MSVDKQRWAGAHYRVERESRGVLMRKRQRRKAAEQAIFHGGPVPEPPDDVVRIFDRTGEVVFEREWGADRTQAVAQEAQIIDDLLHLDVLAFRARYGIETPEAERPTIAAEVAGDDISPRRPEESSAGEGGSLGAP